VEPKVAAVTDLARETDSQQSNGVPVWALIERVRQEGLPVELDWHDEPTPARDWPAPVQPRHALRSDPSSPANLGPSQRIVQQPGDQWADAVARGPVELSREPVRPRPYVYPGSGVHASYYY
jgi:hypothetical protein